MTAVATEVDLAADLDEVVVTARKVPERLEEVPLSITALGIRTLEATGSDDLRDLLSQSAGVTLFGSASQAYETPVIRGMWDFNFSPSSDGQPNVAVFLDGVYLQNTNAISLDLIGIDRVEVIRGPVSALYGRNAFAGAINYVSQAPADDVKVSARAQLGAYGTEALSGSASGPLVTGLIRAGIAYDYQYSGGGYRDPITGRRAGGFARRDVKFTLDSTPTESLHVDAGLYYGQDHFDQDPVVFATPNCVPVAGVYTAQCGEYKANPVQIAAIPASSQDSGNDRTVTAAHLKVSFDFGAAVLSYLGGYNRVIALEYEDSSGMRNGLPYSLYPGPGTANVYDLFGSNDNTEDFSHELRLTSRQTQPVRWSGGVDFYQSHLFTTTLAGEDGSQIPPGEAILTSGLAPLAESFVTPTGSPAYASDTEALIAEKNYSMFGSFDYDVVSLLTIGGELRTTRDEQRINIEKSSLDSVFSALAGGPSPLYEPFGAIPGTRFDFSNYRTYLRYRLTPLTVGYLSVATGTKAGGFNTLSLVPSNQSYGPERNVTYEAGLKTRLTDPGLTLDLAVFHIRSRDLQLYIPAAEGLAYVIQNLGGTSNTGFEAETTWKPIGSLALKAAFAYSDPRFVAGSFDTLDAAACAALPTCAPRLTTLVIHGVSTAAVNLQGLQLPASSQVTVNLSADYAHALPGDIQGFLHGDFRYQDRQYTNVTYLDAGYTGPTESLNLRVGVRRQWMTATLFVQNATNCRTPLAVEPQTELNDLGKEFIATLPSPRLYGADVRFAF